MIETTVNRADYKGDGITTVFPIPFPFIEKEDITVSLVGTDNETTTLTEDYFIDEVTRTVTYPGYPPGEEKAEKDRPPILATGERIILTRDIPTDQRRDLGEIWPFGEVEDALDKLTLICQDLTEKIRRTIKIPLSADANGYDAAFPYPQEGCTIMWKGGKLVNTDYQKPLRDMAARMEEVLREVKAAQADVHSINDDFLKFVMALMDQNEQDLKKYAEELLRQLDFYSSNSKAEILEYVESAKHYSETAKKAAGFDPETYYDKSSVDQIVTGEREKTDKAIADNEKKMDDKIRKAIAAVADYDELYF